MDNNLLVDIMANKYAYGYQRGRTSSRDEISISASTMGLLRHIIISKSVILWVIYLYIYFFFHNEATPLSRMLGKFLGLTPASLESFERD